ncbi:MAG: hypothetical protein ACRDNX_03990, partial [Gaiellaceae bacterium]
MPPYVPVCCGAQGLLVAGPGSTVSRESAVAALLRGKVEQPLLGAPAGRPLIELGRSDPSGLEIFVTLPPPGGHPNDRRYRVWVVGDGYRGILVSDSTRIPGLVSIADIAPTALGREGGLGSRRVDDPAGYLRDLDERIDVKNDARLPASLVAAAVIALLAVARPRAAVLAAALVLGANLALGVLAVTTPWIVVATIGLAAAAAPLLAGLPLAFAFAAVVAAYAVVLAL